MSFRDFDLPKVQRDFGLDLAMTRDLFGHVAPRVVSPEFLRVIKESAPLALAANSEKGRSEWLIAPLLAQLWVYSDRRIAVFSGFTFDVDPEVGLNGVCDFLICRTSNLISISAPVAVIAEAKRDNPAEGFGQCSAGMVAAQRFNARAKNQIDTIYGVSTSGNVWRFLCLQGRTLHIDAAEYYLSQADQILGILMHMVGPLPIPAAA